MEAKLYVFLILLGIAVILRGILFHYMKRNFQKRNLPLPMLWKLAVIFLPLLLSFLLFMVVGRKPRKKMCSHCGYFNDGLARHCEYCGGNLPKEAPYVEDDEEILFIVILGIIFLLAPILLILILNFLAIMK